MSKNKFWNCVILFGVSLALNVPAIAQETLAVTGGQVVTVSGATIENGTIVIKDGKIAAIGTDVVIPVDAKVIVATGKVIMPGFVEAHSSEAMSQANETNPNVPYVSVLDSIDPMRPYFDEARRNGVTSVAVVPGNTTMIGGQAAVIKTGGRFVDYMLLKRDAGIKLSLKPIGSGSRMGHLAALRKELADAKKKLSGAKDEDSDENPDADKDQEGKGEEGGEEEIDKEKDEDQTEDKDDEQDDESENRPNRIQDELEKSMRQLMQGELPAIIYCENAMDVQQALSIVNEYGLKPVLVLGKNCYKAAKQVAASGFPVILDSTLVFWERDPRTNKDSKIVLTEAFRDHDVSFAFQVARSNSNTLGNNYLWYQAATAVKYGMPEADAIKALTLVPAQFLGIDQYVGSLEVGKDGDLAILTGDPLKIDTWVETTIVNGQVVYERKNDEKLKRLLGNNTDN